MANEKVYYVQCKNYDPHQHRSHYRAQIPTDIRSYPELVKQFFTNSFNPNNPDTCFRVWSNKSKRGKCGKYISKCFVTCC